MTTQVSSARGTVTDQPVVATYRNHSDAEAAVRLLAENGIPVNTISIVGRNYETREDIQGFYHPADAAVTGAESGAWFGGLFGLFFGAFGLFIVPAFGLLLVLGPLSGFVAGAVGGAGIGALVSALVAAGIPKDHALKYQARLEAGEFLVIVHGSPADASKAHELLQGTAQTTLEAHG